MKWQLLGNRGVPEEDLLVVYLAPKRPIHLLGQGRRTVIEYRLFVLTNKIIP